MNCCPSSVLPTPIPERSAPISVFHASASFGFSFSADAARPSNHFFVSSTLDPVSFDTASAFSDNAPRNVFHASALLVSTLEPLNASASAVIFSEASSSPKRFSNPSTCVSVFNMASQVLGESAESEFAPSASVCRTVAPVVSAPSSSRVVISSSATLFIASISLIFVSLLIWISAKSSRIECLSPPSSGNRELIPCNSGLITSSRTLPRFVFNDVKLVSSIRTPFAYPSEVRAKSPCASAVACMRY